MHYNFVRIHQTLRTTPAMAAGVTDRLWEVKDIVYLLEEWEARKVAEAEDRRDNSEFSKGPALGF